MRYINLCLLTYLLTDALFSCLIVDLVDRWSPLTHVPDCTTTNWPVAATQTTVRLR